HDGLGAARGVSLLGARRARLTGRSAASPAGATERRRARRPGRPGPGQPGEAPCEGARPRRTLGRARPLPGPRHALARPATGRRPAAAGAAGAGPLPKPPPDEAGWTGARR